MNKEKNLKIIKFPSNVTEAEKRVEAVLFAADEPLDIDSIAIRVGNKINIIRSRKYI